MNWTSRIAAIFRQRKLERDLDEELQFHIELKTRDNIAAGMPPEEARYAALRAFGGVEQKKEECRDAWGLRFVNELAQDLRYAYIYPVAAARFSPLRIAFVFPPPG